MLKSETYTVNTTAQQIWLCTQSSDRQSVIVKNTSATTVYIGGDDVDSTNGYPLAQNEVLAMILVIKEAVYAVTASGTADLRVLSNYNPLS